MSEHMSAEADPTAGERNPWCPFHGANPVRTWSSSARCTCADPATPDAGDASERCPDCGHDQDLHYALGHTGCHDIASRCDCKRVPASTSASEPLSEAEFNGHGDIAGRIAWDRKVFTEDDVLAIVAACEAKARAEAGAKALRDLADDIDSTGYGWTSVVDAERFKDRLRERAARIACEVTR